jgi:hypothetical protein
MKKLVSDWIVLAEKDIKAAAIIIDKKPDKLLCAIGLKFAGNILTKIY